MTVSDGKGGEGVGEGHGLGDRHGEEGGRDGGKGGVSKRRVSTSREGRAPRAHTYISISVAQFRDLPSVEQLQGRSSGLTSSGGGEMNVSARLAYCLRM